MFAGGTYERVMDDHVIPALRALGDAWAAGRCPSRANTWRATRCFVGSRPRSRRPRPGRDQGRPVLVGMPPGARHELGGLIFATALRRAGHAVVYLGSDLPLDDWIAAVERTDARAVVIGAVMPADATAALSVAAGLRAARPEVLIAFGGAAAPEPDGASAMSDRTICLPAEVVKGVDTLSAALTRSVSAPPGAPRAAGSPRGPSARRRATGLRP